MPHRQAAQQTFTASRVSRTCAVGLETIPTVVSLPIFCTWRSSFTRAFLGKIAQSWNYSCEEVDNQWGGMFVFDRFCKASADLN
eukprot:485189-Amphidinium_carterae.1